MPTARLARAALELHRLALAASEIQHLPSPTARREKTSKWAANDPTATTVLDDKRAYVATRLAAVDIDARALLSDQLLGMVNGLREALDAWDAR
jgi:hypothetical protein